MPASFLHSLIGSVAKTDDWAIGCARSVTCPLLANVRAEQQTSRSA